MKRNILLAALAAAVSITMFPGCGPESKPAVEKTDLNSPDAIVGKFARLYQFDAVPVMGFGIVAGLNGTGSAECPPQLREQLLKYIWQKIPDRSLTTPEGFLSSNDTAVVEVYGVIPPLALRRQTFDLKIRALPDTQTTSLSGGRLYTADLKEMSRLRSFDQFAKTVATGEGPVFIDSADSNGLDRREGFVLAGGMVNEDARLYLQLNNPDFLVAGTIRNKINERFGSNTATAISNAQIQLTIPEKYLNQKQMFLAMVSMLYVAPDNESLQNRIFSLIDNLKNRDDKQNTETALCAIGKPAIRQLLELLESPDAAVRFHAARAALVAGDKRPLPVLQKIINDRNSPYRIQAIEAVGNNAGRTEAVATLQPVLAESDFNVRFAAYEQLRKLNDVSISSKLIAGDLLLDSVFCAGPRVIYVSRSGFPRIVLFGSPILCEKNVFVSSDDNNIVINAQPGEQYVSIMRKHPKLPKLLGPLKSTYELANIIRTLCQDVPDATNKQLSPGLSISYAELIVILEKMCSNGSVNARFMPGPPPQIQITPRNQ